MTIYNAPHQDAIFVLDQLVGLDQMAADYQLEDTSLELADVVIQEAGKLASDVLAPLNAQGDKQGAQLVDNKVVQTPGYAEAYQQYVENGWATLTGPVEFGGQGLPHVLGTAVNELWHSANMAFALCPMLSQGAVEALIAHGSDELQQRYLAQLISGEWAGTMNLTEPNAGSDLAAVACKATPDGEQYRIRGQKIFITWGDHQMTSNIIHLVLARLPDAPAGVKGISLFLVPKFLLDDQGQPGELNDVRCISLEHKLGIHASPTCTMSFGDNDGAIGYLIGEPNKGLNYMFTMMNHARQAVGLQGLSISERAYQQALAFAKERTQGTNKEGRKIAIIEYPDVRRMLMAMKSGCEAMRALAFTAAADIDRAHHGDQAAKARVEFFTPIVKGWMTELAQEVTSLNIQVHGGMGFVEETGAAQHYRDARILPIYEGTTGIQALDLVGRKTLSDNGAVLGQLLAEMQTDTQQLSLTGEPTLIAIATELEASLEVAQQVQDWLLTKASADRKLAGTISFDYLMMMGYLCGGWLMAKSALQASEQMSQDNRYGTPFLQGKQGTAQFFAEHYLPRARQHGQTILGGLTSTFALTIDQL
ncbi:acyl-CoA dehydrogenase [Maribrevibacterium harenarium]|uniref:3-methylmercaptopropionyl-CoA dehydrogenase n=1 Tax=Maribrevibacterium harenarium TaxID=2589817 RepID=A0A501WEU1_9GAMM|nr:acyl-CoA dehydrogenase [Maribrevibacterium harenarium]TPE48099.1 acyl-CoA dehydrogenase [Maribrevibacterium harenarium]